MWEQMKRAMVGSARKVCGSVKGGWGRTQRVRWNDEVKAGAWRKEAAWKEMFEAVEEEVKEICMKEKRKIKMAYFRPKRK